MYTTEDKYLPLKIKVKKNPVIFVGMNPGKTRNGKYSKHVWDGDTRTSNLLREVVEPYTNIILTNVCNYQHMTTSHVNEGINDLKEMIEKLKPRKIITLGTYAYLTLNTFSHGIPVKKFAHPSYVVRFNRDREEYVEKIRKELDEQS